MRLLNALMSRFVKTGTLRIVDAGGASHVHGGETDGPSVTVRLTDPKLHVALALNPELKAGEAYMDGTLVVEDGTIRDLLMLFALNRENLRGHPLQRRLRKAYKAVRNFHQRNVLGRSRENVAHHYDISNDFYRLFLDDDLHYSCAYFASPDDSLEVAQQNKLRHVAAKLALEPGQRVLDIGCGWGGMALFLAAHADVEVVGVTLSQEQQALATQRAKDRGLDGRVRFDLVDYREVTERFDRVVSIGMFEHVGVTHFDEYFGAISGLLAEDGVALVHSIGRAAGPGSTAAWLRKYIFPGGYSPALSETLAAVERAGLWATDIEILRLHYAKTLQEWDRRFQARRGEVASMFDERFCRMWEFYLIISEIAFTHGNHMVFQLQMTRDVNTLPITRDYMARAEAALAAPPRTTESAP